jgi:hypothetical protein
MSLEKIIAGTVVGAGAVAGVMYLMNVKRAQVQLQVTPKANIHKVSLEGLTIRVDALIKNPTGASFKIKYPFIEITHKGVLAGSSQVVNKNIKIPAYGEVMIQDIMVNISVLSFFSVMYDVVKALLNNKAIVFTVGVITTIDLGVTQLPFEYRKDLALKHEKNGSKKTEDD